ncbi:transposase [Halobacillus rhizosphaerae]|uniref:transposase n=1 Tax=Halobacillus rhizosphaerae TaxID=3064889 RepID=UPI00398B9DED
MVRKPRVKSANGIYHIVMRGINKQTIFEMEEDKHKFLETLLRYKQVSRFELYSFCLMDNHVHLLLKESHETVSQFMKRICSSYVYWYNQKYDRCGHLFQERYYSDCVQTLSSFFAVLRYIHQNPLKAGVVEDVWESKWTSIHDYLENGNRIDKEKVLKLFSTERKVAIEKYLALMEETKSEPKIRYEKPVKLTDDEVRNRLLLQGIPNSSMLQRMEKRKRNQLLVDLKGVEGVSIRQIARITGLSKSLIGRL